MESFGNVAAGSSDCDANFLGDGSYALSKTLYRAFSDAKNAKKPPSELADMLNIIYFCLQRTLEVYKEETHSTYWANIQYMLGEVVGDAIVLFGSSSQKVKFPSSSDDIIDFCNKSLKVVTKRSFPLKWAGIQLMMGDAYKSRNYGDEVQNVEKAITCFRNALTLSVQEDDPVAWGSVSSCLGNLLMYRKVGDHKQNLEEAIEHLENAKPHIQLRTNGKEWIVVMERLVLAQRMLQQGKCKHEDILLERYQEELKECSRNSDPNRWAKLHSQIGDLFFARHVSKGENYKPALLHFQEVLSVPKEEIGLFNWARAHVLCMYMKLSSYEGRAGQVEKIIGHGNQALTFFTINNETKCFIGIRSLMTYAYCIAKEPHDVLQLIRDTLKEVEDHASQRAPGLLLSRSLIEHQVTLDKTLFATLIHMDDTANALQMYDEAKARILREMVFDGVDVMNRLETDEDKKDFSDARREVRIQRHKLDCTAGDEEEHGRTWEKYRAAKATIDKHEQYVAKHWLGGVAQSCSDDIGLTQSLTRKYIVLMFVIAPKYELMKSGHFRECLHMIAIWDDECIVYIMDAGKGGGTLLKQFHSPTGSIVNWFTGNDPSDDLNSENVTESVYGEKDYLTGLGRDIRFIFDKIPHECISRPLLVVPHQALHKVPFAALPLAKRTAEGSTSTAGEPMLMAEFFNKGITTAPSLSIVSKRSTSDERDLDMETAKIVMATNQKLCYPRQLEDVTRHRPYTPQTPNLVYINSIGSDIKDKKQMYENIRTHPALSDCDIVHFTCHGIFADNKDAVNVSKSPTEVVDGSWLDFIHGAPNMGCAGSIAPSAPDISRHAALDFLSNGLTQGEDGGRGLTMADIWSMDLSNCKLACIVACSSGTVNILSTSDESFSIGTAFLVAGAKHVVCTLWPVHEIVAVMVMSRFYKNISTWKSSGKVGPISFVECLNEAQLWFRNLSKEEYEHYALDDDEEYLTCGAKELPDNKQYWHWAAFKVIGA